MPLGLTPAHLILILVIALIVVGPGKLPEVGQALGKSIKEFRKAASDVQEATSLTGTATPAPVSAPAQAVPVAPAPVQAAPIAAPVPAPVAAAVAETIAAPAVAQVAPTAVVAAEPVAATAAEPQLVHAAAPARVEASVSPEAGA
jgi:TatA/E family protein of Tat protein translocase